MKAFSHDFPENLRAAEIKKLHQLEDTEANQKPAVILKKSLDIGSLKKSLEEYKNHTVGRQKEAYDEDDEDLDDSPFSDTLSIFGAMPSEQGKKSSLHSSLLARIQGPETSEESGTNSSGQKPPEIMEFEKFIESIGKTDIGALSNDDESSDSSCNE